MRIMRTMSIWMFGCLLVVMGVTGCGAQEAASTGVAPGFTLNDINGQPVSLADFKGNVVIVDFFASWCPPCRREIPDFIALANAYRAKGVTIIGISVEDAAATKSFVQDVGINYPVLVDDGTASDAYGPIRSIPTTFVIDRKGNIAKKYIGAMEKAVFEADIQALL